MTGTTAPTRDRNRNRSTVDEKVRSALVVRDRPPRPSGVSASLTHSWRALVAFKHFPGQLVDIMLMPFIFLVLFTYLFGGAFAGSTEEYLQYFLPGVLVMTVLMMTVYTGTALNTDITKGIHDRFRTLPFWQPATIVGNLRPQAGLGGVLLAMALLIVFAFSVSWIFAAIGISVKAPERVSGESMIVLYPLVFTSNVFVDPATMPALMRAIVEVNPVSKAASAARGLVHGNLVAADLWWTLLTCVALVAVFGPLTMRLYRRKNAA
jgi:ABC-2 type transport system permease protein